MDGLRRVTESLPAELDLLDWKRRVVGLYAEVRAAADPRVGWERWRSVRNELFASHPQSPLEPPARRSFAGLPYFNYDTGYRALGTVHAADPMAYDIATSGEHEGSYRFTRFAVARFELTGRRLELELELELTLRLPDFKVG